MFQISRNFFIKENRKEKMDLLITLLILITLHVKIELEHIEMT